MAIKKRIKCKDGLYDQGELGCTTASDNDYNKR